LQAVCGSLPPLRRGVPEGGSLSSIKGSTMSHQEAQGAFPVEGMQPEALSNEVLKLKVDDLFQEIELLKKRVARLENAQGLAGTADSAGRPTS
jgi:hypothetical protein